MWDELGDLKISIAMNWQRIHEIVGTGRADDDAWKWSCPDENALAAYAEGLADETQKLTVESHISNCRLCRGQLAFLVRECGKKEPCEVPQQLLFRVADLVSAPKPRMNLAWGWSAAAAAAAVLIFVFAVYIRQPTLNVSFPSPAPVVVARRLPAPETQISAPLQADSVRKRRPIEVAPELISPSNGKAVDLTQPVFRWKSVEHALFYDIRVTTSDGQITWEGRAETTQIRSPQDLQLLDGQKYFVWVVAHLQEGRTVKAKAVSFRAEQPRK